MMHRSPANGWAWFGFIVIHVNRLWLGESPKNSSGAKSTSMGATVHSCCKCRSNASVSSQGLRPGPYWLQRLSFVIPGAPTDISNHSCSRDPQSLRRSDLVLWTATAAVIRGTIMELAVTRHLTGDLLWHNLVGLAAIGNIVELRFLTAPLPHDMLCIALPPEAG